MPPKSTTPAFFAITGNGSGGAATISRLTTTGTCLSSGWTASSRRKANERAKKWTELFQKPAGRLVLFLLVGGIFVAFILTRRGPQPKPDDTTVASQATQAKSYSFKEDIKPLSRTEATPSPREPERVAARPTPTPKPPPPIPQTIFATREQSMSEYFLPYGRLLRCELVNTVDPPASTRRSSALSSRTPGTTDA